MADCYYLDQARNQQGPVSTEEIARLIRIGTIRRDTMIWSAGMPEWSPAGQAREFAALFAGAAPPPPAGPPPRPAGAGPSAGGYQGQPRPAAAYADYGAARPMMGFGEAIKVC